MATDLDKYIDRINTARKNKFITSSEAVELRNLARSRANRKGDFGAGDRNILNSAFNKALNNRGTAAREQGRLPIGVTPDQPLPPPSTQRPTPKPTPTPPPTTQKPTTSPGFEKWLKGYSNLGDSDKRFVKSLIGGDPTSFAVWQTMSSARRGALRKSVDESKIGGNDITKEERKYLKEIFSGNKINYPQTPATEETGDGGGRDTGDNGQDSGEGGTEGGGGGGTVTDETGSSVGEETSEEVVTEDKKAKKIKFPEGGETNRFIPDDSERIFMPNLESKITKQVERLTLNLIDFTREFIEAGQDYKSIDYVPLQEVFDENDVLYFVGKDPNSPMAFQEEDRSVSTEIINEIVEALKLALAIGDESNPAYKPRPGPEYVWYADKWFFFGGNTDALPYEIDWEWNPEIKMWVDPNNPPPGLAPGEEPPVKFNYAEFLDFFSLSYEEGGTPVYTFNVELEDAIIPGEVELVTQYNSADIEDDTLDE